MKENKLKFTPTNLKLDLQYQI